MWRSKLHEEKQWHVKKNKLEVKLESMLCNVFTATCGWCIAVIVTLWMGRIL